MSAIPSELRGRRNAISEGDSDLEETARAATDAARGHLEVWGHRVGPNHLDDQELQGIDLNSNYCRLGTAVAMIALGALGAALCAGSEYI